MYSLFKRMEALGGDCGVQARRDGTAGSVFWFSFPYRPDTSILSYNSTKLMRPSRSNEANIDVECRAPSPVPGAVLGTATLSNSSFKQTKRTLITHTESTTKHGRAATVNGSPSPPTITTPARFSSVSPPAGDGLAVLTAVISTPTAAFNTNNNAMTILAPLKILVTDDAPTILKVCQRMLTINGHIVDTAVNGNESLTKLKTKYINQEYDVLVTDIQMPVMDGIECTKRFRAWEEEQQCLLDAQGIPRRDRFLIVGMSANSDAQTKHDAMEAGMDSFCPKPFKYEDFEAVMVSHHTRFGNKVSQDCGVEKKDSKEYLNYSCL